jgi:hypothetical protein
MGTFTCDDMCRLVVVEDDITTLAAEEYGAKADDVSSIIVDKRNAIEKTRMVDDLGDDAIGTIDEEE